MVCGHRYESHFQVTNDFLNYLIQINSPLLLDINISFPYDWVRVGKKSPLSNHHHKKKRINISFCSSYNHSCVVQSCLILKEPPVKCKSQDGWWKHFFATPFFLPYMPMDAGCSEKGHCRETKKQRGKQKIQWLTSTGEILHCSIKASWASSLPSTNSWVVSIYVAGAESMCEAFIFLQLCSSSCLSGKMCVHCLGSFLNKPKVLRRNSLPGADRTHKLRAKIIAVPSTSSPGGQAREGADKGQINHIYSPRKLKNHRH